MNREKLASSIALLASVAAVVNLGFLAVNAVNFFNNFPLIGLGVAADNAAMSMPGWALAMGLTACLAGANPNQHTKAALIALAASLFASALWLVAMVICQVIDSHFNDLAFVGYALFSLVLWVACCGLVVYFIGHLHEDKPADIRQDAGIDPSQPAATALNPATPIDVDTSADKWSANTSAGYQWSRAGDAASGSAGTTADNFDWKS